MHRAETILDAILSLLTGLTTTGEKVERGRVYKIAAWPSLSIEMGSDQASDEGRSVAFQTRSLEVGVTSYAKADEDTETALNTIRAEVYAAMMADHTLGLDFVLDVIFSGDSPPQLSGDSEQPAAAQTMNYSISYRHSLISAES